MKDIFPMVIGIFIIKNMFFSDPTPPKEPVFNYTIKMNQRVIEVEHCDAKDGVIVYKKKDGKTRRMIESRNVKCIKTEG